MSVYFFSRDDISTELTFLGSTLYNVSGRFDGNNTVCALPSSNTSSTDPILNYQVMELAYFKEQFDNIASHVNESGESKYIVVDSETKEWYVFSQDGLSNSTLDATYYEANKGGLINICYNKGFVPLPENANLFFWISRICIGFALLFALIAMCCDFWKLYKGKVKEITPVEEDLQIKVILEKYLSFMRFWLMFFSFCACMINLVGLLSPNKIAPVILTSMNVLITVLMALSLGTSAFCLYYVLSQNAGYWVCFQNLYRLVSDLQSIRLIVMSMIAMLFGTVFISYLFSSYLGYDNASLYTGHFSVNTSMTWDSTVIQSKVSMK
jgi:hypothetical protein